jgi:hypothetical protein
MSPPRRPRRTPDEIRTWLIRFCRWAQDHPDLIASPEAFVDRFLSEVKPTFGRPPAGAAPVTPTAGGPPPAEAPPVDDDGISLGSIIGAVVDRITR